MVNEFRIIGYIISNCDEDDNNRMLEAINDSLGASKLEVGSPNGEDYDIVTLNELKEMGISPNVES